MRNKLDSAIDIELKELNKKKYFLFLTANENEKNAFLNYFLPIKDGFRKYRHISGNIYYIGMFGKYPIIWTHLRAQGSYRSGASKETVDECTDLFNIIATFSVGIAFGIDPNNQNIGDVLVSSSVFPYESMRVSEINFEEKYELRDQQRKNNSTLSSFLEGLDWINNTNAKHYVGTFLCGEKLIDSKNTKEKLIKALTEKNINDVIGGDMETTGIELSHRRKDNVNWITIKGISDWADGNKNNPGKKEYQILAANNALNFVYRVFSSRQLENVFNLTNIAIENCKNISDIYINGVKLFYYRNMNNMTIHKLANKLISNKVKYEIKDLVKLLENYESININDFPIKFYKTNYYILKKIENILMCKGELSNLHITESEKQIYKNRNKHMYIPVTNVKAVVFDFDGTLTIKNDNKSCWQRIWYKIGDPNNLCSEYYNMYKRREINHKEWCELTLEYFKEKKLTIEQLDEIAQEILLMPDCEQVFKILKENDINIYICSGSIYTIINKVIGNINKYVTEIRANNFVFNENVIHEINGTKYDFEGKRKYVEEIATKLNSDINQIAFVGNSDNDIYVGQSGARTILVNPYQVDPGIQKHWLYDLGNIDTLKKVLPYLLPEKFLF